MLGLEFIASVGYTSRDSPFYPAGFANVIAVEAVSAGGLVHAYSNLPGEKDPIRAPGVDLAMPPERKDLPSFRVSGSSYATAIVSGIVAAALERNSLAIENLRNNDLYLNGYLSC